MSAFSVEVKQSFTVAGRGVVIIGVLVAGTLPPFGAMVAVHVANRPTVRTRFTGQSFTPLPSRSIDMVLRGLRKEDIPPGSRITEAAPDPPDTP